MKTKDLPAVAQGLYRKMEADGYSQAVLDTTKWILGHFENYCNIKGIPCITVRVAVDFIKECFGFDYYHTITPMQTVLRRPLLILLEFEESGTVRHTSVAPQLRFLLFMRICIGNTVISWTRRRI